MGELASDPRHRPKPDPRNQHVRIRKHRFPSSPPQWPSLRAPNSLSGNCRPPAENPSDVASIVDSVLADLRPRLMAEITRKMAEKK